MLMLGQFFILSIPLALYYHTEKVLLVIATKGCAITQHDPNNIKLPIGVVFTMNIDEIARYQLMHIIYAHVPIIRSLCAVNGYYERTTIEHVYRGLREELQTLDSGDQHAVVCFDYTFDKRSGELHIHIMDNHIDEGPLRWILFLAFG